MDLNMIVLGIIVFLIMGLIVWEYWDNIQKFFEKRKKAKRKRNYAKAVAKVKEARPEEWKALYIKADKFLGACDMVRCSCRENKTEVPETTLTILVQIYREILPDYDDFGLFEVESRPFSKQFIYHNHEGMVKAYCSDVLLQGACGSLRDFLTHAILDCQ